MGRGDLRGQFRVGGVQAGLCRLDGGRSLDVDTEGLRLIQSGPDLEFTRRLLRMCGFLARFTCAALQGLCVLAGLVGIALSTLTRYGLAEAD